MTDWPDDWFRDAAPGGANLPGNASDPAAVTPAQGTAATERAAAEPTVRLPHRSAASRSAGPGGPEGPGGPGRPGGSWPEQPAARAPRTLQRSPVLPGQFGDGAGGGYPGWSGRPRWRRWLRPRPIMAVLAGILSIVIVGSVASYFYLDSKLTRKNILVDYNGRPTAGSGQNWLITGSDSRQGLTRTQERKLATGH